VVVPDDEEAVQAPGGPRAELSLRQNEEELRDFVENAAEPLHCIGPDGTILWANQAELDLLGYTRDEYVGHPVAAFHVDAANIEDMLARLNRNEALRNHEARLRAKDGSVRHVLVTSSVYWRDGQFIHTRCFTRDVTERKVAEEARQLQQRRTERLNKVISAIADAVGVRQVFEAVVDQVAAALEASSVGLWLVRGRRARLVHANGYSDEARRSVEAMTLETGGSSPAVDTIRSGEPLWIASRADLFAAYPHLASTVTRSRFHRVACLPLSTRDGTIGALGLAFDDDRRFDDDEKSFLVLVARFTGQALERVKLLEAEREHRARAELLYGLAAAVNRAERIEQVFEAALDAIARASNTSRAAILVSDSDGVMRFKAWRGLSDVYRRAVEGHSPWSRETLDPKPLLSGAVESDPAMAAHLPVFLAEGIGALAFIPVVAAGKLIGKFMIYYDQPHEFGPQEVELASAIADHVASAASRFAGAAELLQTVRFNEMFTGILAHDLRNPLGAIIMAGRLANAWNESDRLSRPLARILTSGERMTRMIDQLLDFTRVRLQGGIPIDPEVSDLAVIVRQAMDELEGAHPRWSLRLGVSGDTRGSWDSDRLSQVFSNLLANAIQHGREAWGVDVIVDADASDDIVVNVHNSGAIPEELLPRLFEPLVGSGRSLEHSSGLGLGLYITREIVRAHGGSIEVLSDEASGTTFVVTLPRSPVSRRDVWSSAE
jgi:PAS domain S-box-containing protein